MKFRKKPIIVEAIQWNGNNWIEVSRFLNGQLHKLKNNVFMINTLEGIMEAKVNDWIIKGIKGEFYPCKSDIFEKSYEEIKEK